MESQTNRRVDRATLEAYLASHTGNDGGNPSSGLWICGIEFGGGFDGSESSFEPEVEPNGWSEEHLEKYPDSIKAPYHQKAAKFLVALEQLRLDPNCIPSIDGWRDYVAKRLYTRDGVSFKLNLFPFSSPSVGASGWREAYGAHLGFNDKREYLDLCRSVRFEFLRRQREKFAPRIILGTGKTYLRDFASAFGFDIAGACDVRIAGGGSARTCYVLRQCESVLVVCPFFGGRYGINSVLLPTEGSGARPTR